MTLSYYYADFVKQKLADGAAARSTEQPFHNAVIT